MMDTPETFAAALLESAAKAGLAAREVIQKGALNIKNEARKNVAASAPIHNAHAAQTINYETQRLATSVTAEIGYDLSVSKSAHIAWVLEYGGGGDHSPPHRDLGRALDNEEPRFEQAIALIAEGLL